MPNIPRRFIYQISLSLSLSSSSQGMCRHNSTNRNTTQVQIEPTKMDDWIETFCKFLLVLLMDPYTRGFILGVVIALLEPYLFNIETETESTRRQVANLYQKTNEIIPSERQPCAICFEPMLERSDSAKLRCGHYFHSACIVPWLTQNLRDPFCPLCRASLKDEP